MDTKSSPQNIQDAFLNTARREKETVTVHLMNNVKLTGRIKSFDKFSVLLEHNREDQLIFKHAISTIVHTRRGATGDLRPHAPHESAHAGGAPPQSVSAAEPPASKT